MLFAALPHCASPPAREGRDAATRQLLAAARCSSCSTTAGREQPGRVHAQLTIRDSNGLRHARPMKTAEGYRTVKVTRIPKRNGVSARLTGLDPETASYRVHAYVVETARILSDGAGFATFPVTVEVLETAIVMVMVMVTLAAVFQADIVLGWRAARRTRVEQRLLLCLPLYDLTIRGYKARNYTDGLLQRRTARCGGR